MSAILRSSADPAPEARAPVPLLRTLVLCDLVDSTALVERLGDLQAAEIFRRHDRLTRALVHQHGGREIDKTDGFLLMFDRPIAAVAFALAYQRALRDLGTDAAPLRARVGIHFGDVLAWDNAPEDVAKGAKPFEVEGLVKPVTSRLMQLALPGQILLSGVAYQLAHRGQDELGDAAATALWRTHGRYRFKGLPDPVPVFEVGEKDIAPLKAPPWSGKAHREVPFWRRPATLVFESALLLALVALPLWYLFRPEPAIAFAQRDWIVVGSLKNLTDDSSFDDSLQTAFRIGLEQSRYVNVLSDLKARDTVELMQRDPEHTEIDRTVGSEVAIRNGARALVLPTVAEIGGRVRVTAEVVDPDTQTTVWSESADGVGEASVLPSLDEVNRKLRVRLGEALATVSTESQPLDKVATRNLDALRAYSLGERAYISNPDEALQLFRQALKLDPQFALAHLSIARIHTSAGQDADAIRELEAALALREHLPARDAMYVEALRASFGAPRPALDQWKLLAKLYPDFFAAQGTYAYFAWELGNRYEEVLENAKRAASDKNPHPDASVLLLGTLYLGLERYDDALREFEGFSWAPGTPLGFHASALAALRRYDEAEALFDREEPDRRSPEGARIRAAFAVDQGKWSEARDMIRNAKTKPDLPSTLARQLSVMDLGFAAIEAKTSPAFARALGDAVKRERSEARSISLAEQSATQFRILFAAYLAAKADDAEQARAALAATTSMTRDADYPVLVNLREVAEAELALAEHRPNDAIAMLARRVDGTELYVTHIVLKDAYAASGKPADALKEATWLASHRGRAYTEFGAEWVMVPFDVAQANLAMLDAAEYARAAGQTGEARQWQERFAKAWPNAAAVPFVAARLAAKPQ
ncbi:MAG TPA: putative peptide modification system cyclase [Rhodanobacteraceae bacterium]|nr:putative peptide modification system cyclase [Rhodanobacteraceae bacterium]